MESMLLDMRNCTNSPFDQIYQDMLQIKLLQQPGWIRPLIPKSSFLKNLVDYDLRSRAWEYPWAVQAAELGQSPLRVLDVGGGGSPFAGYLAKQDHEVVVIDPSMDQGSGLVVSRNNGLRRNVRSLGFWTVSKALGINRVWGIPSAKHKTPVQYYPYSATDIKFPDRYFDRVFCLSVMEHIPEELWQECMQEYVRVLRPGGRLVITFDMSTPQADESQYLKLVEYCPLKLVGDPRYKSPITPEDKALRHPGHTFETIGLVWQA